MKISVNQPATCRQVHADIVQRLGDLLLKKAAVLDSNLLNINLSVLLADNDSIKEINVAHLDHNDITDVISFKYRPDPNLDDTSCYADIVVNVELAEEIGPEYEGRDHELALYIAHGINHLTGADDNTDQDRKNMRNRELFWLKGAKEIGLLTALFLSEEK